MYLDEVQYEQLFLYLRFLIAVFAALEKSIQKILKITSLPGYTFV